jgi:hypothetical protein
VLEFFRRNIHLRSCVAIVAAYAMALQMLLASIAPMPAATPALGGESFVICHGNGDSPADDQGKTAPAVRHLACVMCSMVSFAPSFAEAFTTAVLLVARAAPFDISQAILTAHGRRHDPRTSQGPPQLA